MELVVVRAVERVVVMAEVKEVAMVGAMEAVRVVAVRAAAVMVAVAMAAAAMVVEGMLEAGMGHKYRVVRRH